MSAPADDTVTLQAAADRLGVHYMTAYRYVRLGLLPAEKVGSTWRVLAADVEAMRKGPPRTGGRRQPAPWAERLRARLLVADEAGAWGVVEAALTAGTDPVEIHLDVLAPAMREVGELWARGEIDVAEEHRASVVATRLIGRLSPRFNRRGRSRGCVVVGCPPGERHGLPSLLVADVVRNAGWSVVDLGADVPLASFVHAVQKEGSLAAVAVSVTWEGSIRSAAETVDRLGDAVSVPILVGGRAAVLANGELAGAAAVAADARGACEALESLLR